MPSAKNFETIRPMKKWALIGASRGLGRAVAESLPADDRILIVSRKEPVGLKREAEFFRSDLAEERSQLLEKLRQFEPDMVIDFAAGGPYGEFAQKNFKDHLWAFQVSFIAKAELVHGLAGFSKPPKAVCWIGSAIAEDEGDVKAGAYAASKAALKSLFFTLRKEQSLPFPLLMFSPGYIDTDLLPAGAAPRKQAESLWKPSEVAAKLLSWLSDPGRDGYKRLTPYRY